MKMKTNKVLSILLSMALTLGCLPGLSAFAAEESNDVTINVWLSNAEMGDPVERFSKSERMYLCYTLTDAKGDLVEDIGDFQATMTMYNSDWTIANEETYSGDNWSWISTIFDEAGYYYCKVEFSGALEDEVWVKSRVSLDTVDNSLYLNTWVSNSEMGEPADYFLPGDTIYYCYEIVDSKEQPYSGDTDYMVSVKMADPDGSVHVDSIKGEDSGWFSIKADQVGYYKNVFSVDGVITFENTELNARVIHDKTYTVAWLASDENGTERDTEANPVKVGERIYYHYALVDEENNLVNECCDMHMKITYLLPDGTEDTDVLDDYASGWFSMLIDQPGKWTFSIELYGDYLYAESVSFNAISSETEASLGDVNQDGAFSVSDIVVLQKWILKTPDTKLKDWKSADFNHDEIIDIFDLGLMKKALLSDRSGGKVILTPMESVQLGSEFYLQDGVFKANTSLLGKSEKLIRERFKISEAECPTYVVDYNYFYDDLSVIYIHTNEHKDGNGTLHLFFQNDKLVIMTYEYAGDFTSSIVSSAEAIFGNHAEDPESDANQFYWWGLDDKNCYLYVYNNYYDDASHVAQVYDYYYAVGSE